MNRAVLYGLSAQEGLQQVAVLSRHQFPGGVPRVSHDDVDAPAESREQVYHDWLIRKLDGAAEVETCRLDRFRLVRLFRRGRRTGKGRARKAPQLPEAVLKGRLKVLDSEAFSHLVARGIGRHRAFGFGMLLLRPPSRA